MCDLINVMSAGMIAKLTVEFSNLLKLKAVFITWSVFLECWVTEKKWWNKTQFTCLYLPEFKKIVSNAFLNKGNAGNASVLCKV